MEEIHVYVLQAEDYHTGMLPSSHFPSISEGKKQLPPKLVNSPNQYFFFSPDLVSSLGLEGGLFLLLLLW